MDPYGSLWKICIRAMDHDPVIVLTHKNHGVLGGSSLTKLDEKNSEQLGR